LSLVDVVSTHTFTTNDDLLALLPANLPQPFHTGDLAAAMQIQRWIAQRIAYCLRKTGGAKLVGKQGNALTYQLVPAKAPATRRSASRRCGKSQAS
jgi:hypothetical protein